MTVNVRHTGNQAIDDFQREVVAEFANLARGISSLPTSPLDRAVVLADLDLTTTGQTFDTKLGGLHQGCIVIRRTADIRVWEGPPAPGKITLAANVAGRVSVLVF